jgi:hypothetical protein
MLQSLGMTDTDVPFLGKPRVFSACINPHALGKPGPRKRTSLCQYALVDEEPIDGMPRSFTQLYSYRSMLLFRLIDSIPLPAPAALAVAALLSPSLVIADIRFPIVLAGAAALRLTSAGRVTITFPEITVAERQRRMIAWAAARRGLRAAHLFPVKNIWLPEGSTSHYAGTIPHAPKGTYPLTSDHLGHSNDLPGVWIADSSTFRGISAKPPTFTIMANACRVAENMLKN